MKCNIAKTINSHSSKWAGKQYRLFLVILLVIVICIGCESGEYSDKATGLIDSIDTLLVSEGLCKDKNDCVLKQFVLYEYARGIYVSTYGITDQSIANKIIGLCIAAHAKNPTIKYELHMHPQTKDETLKGKSKTTILQLILKKEE